MAKTPCKIGRKEFIENSSPVTFEIAGNPISADPREFSTGSFGWYFTGKVNIEVAGKSLPVQVGCNLAVVGSKDVPKEEVPKLTVVESTDVPKEEEVTKDVAD